MKKISTVTVSLILAFLLTLTLIPAFMKRVSNEAKNDNVTVSLYYNDLANRFDGKELDKAVQAFYDIGVTTVSVSEENLNAMVARGDVTNIKYNVLRHKYDDESIELANIIAEKAPKTSYNSELIITKNNEAASFIRKSLSEKYTLDDFSEIEGNNGMTVFSIYEGVYPTNEIVLGYNLDAIEYLWKKGFDICLVVKLQDTKRTDYLDTIEDIVKKYDVKYMSIRKSLKEPVKEKDGKAHYERLSSIIKDNALTLVLTESPSQLSNEKYFGFDHVFSENSDRVVRSYETYDASHADATKYKFRYQQYLNSTIDRNIRFITVSQIHLSNTNYEKLNEYTLSAIEEYIKKITELGYTVNDNAPTFDYTVGRTPLNAIAAAIMVLIAYSMLCMVFGIDCKRLFAAFVLLAILSFGVTFILPSSLTSLYPSAWAVLFPCFGMTVVLAFLKGIGKKLPAVLCAVAAPLIIAAIMSLGGLVLSALLSGIDYYVNNEIFRGIKLSLFLPLVYSVAAYYFMYMKSEKSIAVQIRDIAVSEIKVYWIVIAAVAGYIGLTYLRRSGNVNTISALETAMRNFITDTFAARPRTKEFLIGYPCIVLLAYYIRKTDLTLIRLGLSAGGAILAASISNSFCHVFTDATTIYMRVVNGLIIGALVCVAVYVGNLIFLKLCKWVIAIVKEKYFTERT